MKTLILGDLSPTSFTNPVFDKKNTKKLFNDTVPVFKNHDFVFVNLECALTDSNNAIEKFGPNLKASKNTAAVLKDLNVNCCGLSNNHIFDFGIEGVNDTKKALSENGIDYTGYGDNEEESRKNYYIDDNGKKICIIAVCEHEYSYALPDREGSRPFDVFDTLEDIREAKKTCDRVIVIYHGGKEHCLYPSPRLLKTCRAMIKSGADLVTCQHSHCIGCYENYKGGHILYGQGNFHFVKDKDEIKYESWNTSLAISYDTESNSIEFIPFLNNDSGIELAKGETKEKILSSFAERNKTILNGDWKKGWHEFCIDHKDMYINAVKGALTKPDNYYFQNIFNHYLDCEAHSDVLRELFPTANWTNEK